MPAPLLNSDYVYQARIRGRDKAFNQEFDTVVNYIMTVLAAPVTTDMQQLLEAVYTNWRDNILPGISANYVVERYELRSIVDRFGSSGDFRPVYGSLLIAEGGTSADNGAEAGATLPPYASVSAEARSFDAGRRSFGIYRLGPVLESEQDYGRLTDPGLTTWESTFNAIMGNLSVGGPVPDVATAVIFSRENLKTTPVGVWVDPTSSVKLIDQLLVAPVLGTQMTRKQQPRRVGY